MTEATSAMGAARVAWSTPTALSGHPRGLAYLAYTSPACPRPAGAIRSVDEQVVDLETRRTARITGPGKARRPGCQVPLEAADPVSRHASADQNDA